MNSSSSKSNATPIVELRNVEFSFGTLSIHRGISLKIYAGEVVTLLGPSGTGKTVLLKIMLGLLRPQRGKVLLFGQDISELEEEELFPLRRRAGILFQGAALFDSMTVFENVAYGLRQTDEFEEEEIETRVMRNLELVGLPEKRSALPAQLSGGQRKRIGLARALAVNPELVLFDEPTTGLDPTSVKKIDDLVLCLKRDLGIASVVVTHDIASARRVSDRWVLLNKGKLVVEGVVDQVLQESEMLQQFVEGNWKENGGEARK